MDIPPLGAPATAVIAVAVPTLVAAATAAAASTTASAAAAVLVAANASSVFVPLLRAVADQSKAVVD